MKTTVMMCRASPQTICDNVTVPTVVTFRFSISVKVATLLPFRPFPCKQNFSILIKLVRGMLYYTTDEFVCVLPSAVTKGGNKSHQRLLAFVLAKAQVTASAGKRGKYNKGYPLVSTGLVYALPRQH